MAKTIIISITAIICTLLLCYSIIECSNNYRYVSYDRFDIPSVLDHKTGKIYSINTSNKKIIITDLINNNISYVDYIQNGSASSMKDPRELGKEQYLEKVKNGTNTSADDRRAEINGWLDN